MNNIPMNEPVIKTYNQKCKKTLKDGTEKVYICKNTREIKGMKPGPRSAIIKYGPERKAEIIEYLRTNSKRKTARDYEISVYMVNKILDEYLAQQKNENIVSDEKPEETSA